MKKRGRLILRCLATVVVGAFFALLGLAWSVSSIGKHVHSCLDQCASSSVDTGGAGFKVISLNLFHGYPRFENVRGRLDLVAQRLRGEQPDFVLLQEVPWRSDVGWAAEYLSERTALNYVYLRGNGNRRSIRFEEGLAILSRHPLHDHHFTELKPRDWVLEHRIALAVTAHTPAGPVQLVTAHLTRLNTRNNAKQAASLEAFIAGLAPHPTILAGDFNALEDSPQIREISKTWTDAFRHVHKRTRAATCCLSPSGLKERNASTFFARVDYIFLKDQGARRWRVDDARLIFDRAFQTQDGYQWVSNHLGVLAEVALATETPQLHDKRHASLAASGALK